MKDDILLRSLEELAERLDIVVREENINLEDSFSPGGLCKVDGKYVLILNSRATEEEKIQTAVRALRRFNLDDIYMKPALRELLEGES
jgi:hypothetical protein